jgi:hypothetical protein
MYVIILRLGYILADFFLQNLDLVALLSSFRRKVCRIVGDEEA